MLVHILECWGTVPLSGRHIQCLVRMSVWLAVVLARQVFQSALFSLLHLASTYLSMPPSILAKTRWPLSLLRSRGPCTNLVSLFIPAFYDLTVFHSTSPRAITPQGQEWYLTHLCVPSSWSIELYIPCTIYACEWERERNIYLNDMKHTHKGTPKSWWK